MPSAVAVKPREEPADVISFDPKSPLRIAVLISGGGTTLKNFLDRIDAGVLDVAVVLVVSSSPDAGGLGRAESAGIPTAVVERKAFGSREAFSGAIFDRCRAAGVDLVVMGGFLKQITLPDDFAHRVVNIHPALIPSFCGKGYYGHFVHEAVLDYGVKLTGCTVHFADNRYDHGPVIIQRPVPVYHTDTPDDVARRVFREECIAYPEAINLFAAGKLEIDGRIVRIRD